MHRIHIVGISPRTGTTLLAECMRVCFEIGRAEEHEVSLSTIRWCPTVYLTKKPDDIGHVGMRLALDPRLTVICMIRDPRDTIMSRHGSRPDEYFTNLGRWKRQNTYVRRLRDHPRFIRVRYEQLVADPDGVQDLLVARIPCLRPLRRFSEFHEGTGVSRRSELALGGLRPIAVDSVARWRRDLPRLRAEIGRYGPIDEELVEHGYERDASWREGIAGLDGDGAAAGSGPVPAASLQKRFRRALRGWAKRPAAAGICAACHVLGIPVG